MTIDIESICTHAQLCDEASLDDAGIRNILPASWNGDSLKARERARDEILRALARRSPPIRESDLIAPEELRRAVALSALAGLYRSAATTPDSINHKHAEHYLDAFGDELLNLKPTILDGLSAPAGSFEIERR